jgi:hypothetical protein
MPLQGVVVYTGKHVITGKVTVYLIPSGHGFTMYWCTGKNKASTFNQLLVRRPFKPLCAEHASMSQQELNLGSKQTRISVNMLNIQIKLDCTCNYKS